MKLYRIPSMPYIGTTAKQVYKLEAQAGPLIDKALLPYIEKVTGADINLENELYQVLIPEALASILNRYDRSSALAAVIGYLRHEHAAEVFWAPDGSVQLTVGPSNASLDMIDRKTLPPKGRR